MAALIGPLIRGVLSWVATSKIFSSVADVGTSLLQLGQVVQWLTDIVDDVFGAAKGGEDYSENWATRTGQQVEQMGQDVKDFGHRVVETILPHSLAFLLGYLLSKYIYPIIHRLDQDETRIGILEGFRRSTDTWRYKYVDPNIKDWRAFHEWFLGWPQGILFRWRDYFANPSHFAAWATPPLVGPIITYLAAREHKPSRDNLTQTLVDATPDVWHHVEQATLAILEKDYP